MKKATQTEFDSLRVRYNELRSLCNSYEREIQELINIVRELRSVEANTKKISNEEGNYVV